MGQGPKSEKPPLFEEHMINPKTKPQPKPCSQISNLMQKYQTLYMNLKPIVADALESSGWMKMAAAASKSMSFRCLSDSESPSLPA
jgi:hypothetical protein